MADFCTHHPAAAKRVGLGLAALIAACAFGGAGAQANGGAKHDFRLSPSIGTPTTTFRVSFSAPFRTDPEEEFEYIVEGVGPRRCPNLFDFTVRRYHRGDRVVITLTPRDLYFNNRRTWCRGAYVGYVYFSGASQDTIIGYFRFGVGRAPVSLEG